MLRRFFAATEGNAATEVALIMPVLLVLFLGIIDTGNALLVNKKTVTAAQIAADLLTRRATVTTADITDAHAGARMAIDPFSRNNFGLDIVSIQFQGTNATPTIIWRQTYDMPINSQATTLAAGLGVQGEGVLVVTARYLYQPVFSGGLIGNFTMREVAITRPRRGSYVARQ